MNNIHFSSQSNEWETPQDFFDKLNKEFLFELDVCATKENTKCTRWFEIQDDGLSKSWDNKNVWCNPPYGREIGKWVKKASEARGGDRGDVNSSKDRYKILSRIYLQQKECGDTLYKRSIKIWRTSKLRPFSFNGGNI